jgi:hypothetical protein
MGDIESFLVGSKNITSDTVQIIHIVTPVEINIKGPKALAVSIANITARSKYGGRDVDLISWARLISKLERVDAGQKSSWKLMTLEVIHMRDSIIPAAPSSIDLSGWQFARKSYALLAWHVSLQDMYVRDDLPGMDAERSVKEVMDRNYSWINAA